MVSCADLGSCHLKFSKIDHYAFNSKNLSIVSSALMLFTLYALIIECLNFCQLDKNSLLFIGFSRRRTLFLSAMTTLYQDIQRNSKQSHSLSASDRCWPSTIGLRYLTTCQSAQKARSIRVASSKRLIMST